ncbi:MAG: hydroxyethylthiazole kinase [Dermatophilaceae bacterium]
MTAADLATGWGALREQGPLVQCLTNIVAASFTANVLLAAGAAPAMVDNVHEARAFAAAASGVLLNLGTPYADTTAAMREAVAGAGESGTPWVLDPVGAGGLPWRTGVASELLGLAAPAVVRGNPSEVLGLAGGAGGRGVDTVDSTTDALPTAQQLARDHDCVVAVSGEVDYLTDGERVLRLANGHVWMTRVTGVGCALGALMAGCVAVTADVLTGAGAAAGALTIAAERAAAVTQGPGTFAARLLDELFALQPEQVEKQVRIW